jgi:Bacteriophage holin of superfamily 6 (Holin_LLH)
MFGFLKRVARQPLNFEQLQILQIVVQQVVLSVEGTLKVPGANKKAVAIELVGQILEDLHLVAPDSLVDAMIESAVSILKSLDRVIEREAKPRYTFDLSGRPESGN